MKGRASAVKEGAILKRNCAWRRITLLLKETCRQLGDIPTKEQTSELKDWAKVLL